MKDYMDEQIRERGESHYKTGGVELVDLLKAIEPNPDLNCAEISALTSIMRYATRMLKTGLNEKDVWDVETYAKMLKFWKGYGG